MRGVFIPSRARGARCAKRSGLDVCHPPRLCPVNRKVLDYGDPEGRHLIVGHHLLDCEWIRSLAIGRLRTFDFCEHQGLASFRTVANWAWGPPSDVIPTDR